MMFRLLFSTVSESAAWPTHLDSKLKLTSRKPLTPNRQALLQFCQDLGHTMPHYRPNGPVWGLGICVKAIFIVFYLRMSPGFENG